MNLLPLKYKSLKMLNQVIFYKSVGKSKKDMIDFLSNHFRYNTMNSWNQSTSYANNMKIYKCIPSEYHNQVYNLMEVEGFYEPINDLIGDFNLSHDHLWQARFNGRSGGYLVLYQGYCESTTIFNFDQKTMDQYHEREFADGYGWMSLKEAKAKGLYKKVIKKIGSWPGRSVDQNIDFSDWSIDALNARVALVQSFDKLCDKIVACVIEMAKTPEIAEETYLVEKTRKVIVDKT